MKNIIRNCVVTMLLTVVAASTVMASTDVPAESGGSLLLTLFIGFFALIVVFQLVPACLLFVGILKGLFSKKQGVEQESSSR